MSRVDNTGGTGFTVDNNNGLVVRTKLNQVIAALSTLSQGSGTPTSGLAAYTPFIDGNTLKIQNSSNDGQVSLGDVSATNFGHASLSASNTFAGGCTFSSTATLNSTTTLAGTTSISGATTFTNDVTFDGATAGRDFFFDRSDDSLTVKDDAKLKIGTGGDLEIFHSSGNTFLTESGSANLKIQASDLVLADNDGTEFFHGQNNAGVDIKHNGNTKIQTVSGGVILTGGAAANITSVTQSSGTVTFDFAASCHHKVTLTQNVTELAAPSNQAIGQSGSIFITQPSSGNYTVAYNAAWFFTGGTTPTLSTSSDAVDRIDYVVFESNKIHCVVSLDVKTGS